MKFRKYHALGNVYIVVEPLDQAGFMDVNLIRRLCSRHFGVGSDGLLVGPIKSSTADFGLRIFNPDGSEAEKSGNGLRIFCRYLWDNKLVAGDEFSVETKGGIVKARVSNNGSDVKVEMGRISFQSADIPVVGHAREVLLESIEVGSCQLVYSAATIGNPHCVVITDEPTADVARELGPLLEVHPNFPHRTNVQFVSVLDKKSIRVEIWERGAGYTLASGSSSCAAAAIAHRLGLCDRDITVSMQGGQIHVEIDNNYQVTMTGPVVAICAGDVANESLQP